jgi:hypothetical protein
MRRYIPFVLFLFLMLVTSPFSFDSATFKVPGWNKVAFTPRLTEIILLFVSLLVATGSYWFIARKEKKINGLLFIGHTLFTLPALVYLLWPSLEVWNTDNPDDTTSLQSIEFRTGLATAIWVLFVVGQLLLLVQLFIALKPKHRHRHPHK